MRIAKWISPVIVGLGLAFCAQATTAGLLELPPGACKPVKACEPAQKVERLPSACKPVQPYVPPVKACEPVQAVKACEPVNGCDRPRELVLDRLANKVDNALHATAYKIHAWKQGGYVKDSVAAPQSAPDQAPASAPAPLPAAAAPRSS
jgi:hypothetical protein